MTYFDEIVNEVAELTDENDHTGAYITVAEKILFDEKLLTEFQKVKDQHMEDGFMTEENMMVRFSWYNYMLGTAAERLSIDQFSKIKGAL